MTNGKETPAGSIDNDAPSSEGIMLHDLAYHLPIASLRFVAVVERAITLPPNAGSTPRGAFGHALKEVGCLYRHQGRPCADCVENAQALAEERPTRCVYGYLFDTPRPPNTPLHERQQDVPHPYVIRPIISNVGGGECVYQPGARLEFELQLFGLALSLVGQVVEACVHLTRRGLGAGRGTAEVRELWEQDPFGSERRLLPFLLDRSTLTLVAGWEEAVARTQALASGSVTLRFLTTTHLVREGSPVDAPEFSTVARALLRRLTLLALFHGGEAPIDLFPLLAQHAEGVRLLAWQGQWRDWDRYSARQDRRMTFGGLIGTAAYEGDVAPFLPYLVYGQAVHIGKRSTFGEGRYRVVGAGLPDA